MNNEGKRWTGAEWATEKSQIMIVGCGGIGSWTTLALARIDHNLIVVDGDSIDETNVQGGQLFRRNDIGKMKVESIINTCRSFGCYESIIQIPFMYSSHVGTTPIMITGVDNMEARRTVFEEWTKSLSSTITPEEWVLIDGRLTLEMYEIFCIQGNNEAQIQEYEKNHLFSSEEAAVLECTAQQTTFTAMGIASMITATLCNWLSNKKLQSNFREVPFYQRMYLPIMKYDKSEIEEYETITA